MARISLDKFINKYHGKSVGIPAGYVGECVSLVQRYLNECFGEPIFARGHAISYGDTLIKSGLGKVVTKPQRGDIMIWGKPFGEIGDEYFGHTAIYLDNATIFDQNNSNVKPTRSSLIRPIFNTKPKQYIRMNKALVQDVKPPVAKPTGEKVTLSPKVTKWGYYKLGVLPVSANIQGYLYPSRFKGGITYDVLGRPFSNTVTVKTRDFGTVNIWIGPKTAHTITKGDKVVPKAQPTKEYLQLDKRISTWNIYKLGTPLKAHLKIATLNPKKFGGLEYEILDRPMTNAITIKTRDFGKVNIYVGADVKHLYKIVRR